MKKTVLAMMIACTASGTVLAEQEPVHPVKEHIQQLEVGEKIELFNQAAEKAGSEAKIECNRFGNNCKLIYLNDRGWEVELDLSQREILLNLL